MKRQPVKDHLGHTFKSVSSMALAYGQEPDIVSRRLSAGWPVRRALLEPIKHESRFAHPVTAPDGKTYKDHKTMCEAYGVPFDRYVARVTLRGWDLDEALRPEKFSGIFINARDHLGKTYPSLAAMARAWHLPVSCLYSRLNAGWDLEKILTTPPKYERLRPEYDAGLD